MTRKELAAKIKAALEGMETIHAEAKDRELTEDEQSRFDAFESDATKYSDELEQLATIDTSAQDRTSTIERAKALLNTPMESGIDRGPTRTRVGVPNLFHDPTGGFGNVDDKGKVQPGSFGQFALDVRAARDGRISKRLNDWGNAVTAAAGDGVSGVWGHEGAFLLPTALGAMIQNVALEASIVRQYATVIPMSTLVQEFPTIDDTSHSSSTVFGGIACYFAAEESQLTSSKPAFGQAKLELHALTALAYLSNRMADWSPISLDSWLPARLGEAIGWKEDDRFINGTGAGEPSGILAQPAIISITKETGQAADTIVLQNIVKADARCWNPTSRGTMIWLANQTCKVQLAQMTLTVGAAGVPVFMPAGGLTQAPYETLYGRPIRWTEKCPALGDAGDIVCCNLSQYYIGDAAGKNRTERNMGLKFDYDQTAYRVVTYVGGMSPWRSAFTPKNGDTMSPFVKIAAR